MWSITNSLDRRLLEFAKNYVLEIRPIFYCVVGIVVNVSNGILYKVRFYDGREDIIPREEMYYIGQEKFSADVEFIVRCEESLVGKAVVARNDADGLFYLGKFQWNYINEILPELMLEYSKISVISLF